MLSRLLPLIAALLLWPLLAAAQGTEVPFGGQDHDTSQPVEITADKLSVDQSDGSAIFEGNVVIGQGDMRLSAAKVRVEYATGDGATKGKIARLLATGDVTLAAGDQAAEAQEAEYTLDSGIILLTGSVVMTQGNNAISSERAEIELGSGKAVLDGRVRTVLQAGGN